VNKKRLLPSLFLSLLIHLGVLTGINVVFVPTPGIPKWRELIPVDMVIIEKEEGEFPSNLRLKETGFSKESLIAKAQTAKGTPSTTPLEDFPGPIPKEGTFKPSLNVEQIPTSGVLPPGQEGKEVESRRVITRSPSLPQHLPAIPHSSSDQSPILEVEEPRVLTLAERGGIPTDSTTLEKITAPLGRNRPHSEFISDLPPIPTIKSPPLPEEKEMILAKQEESLQPPIGDSPTLRPLRALEKAEKKMVRNEPLLTGFERGGTLEGVEKGFSMVIVLDTSGSVKGPPLEGIKKSALEFVTLLGKLDRCGVITFNDEASLVVPLTSDKNRLKREIASLLTKGRNTVLFDALNKASLLLREEKDNRRFVVLFSDGKDEGSRSTLQEVVDRARKEQISFFCFGYSRVERRYLKTLENISQRTGGIFAEAPHFGEIVELFRTARGLKGKQES
jgi:Mg-chelatase subunit ChlD